MSHVRQQIRDALVITLTGLTTTGANVFASRAYPLQDSDLPALLVTTDSEEITQTTIHYPDILLRALTVRVVGVAQATADLDDTLDTICAEVETAIQATQSAATAGGILDAAMALASIEVEVTTESEQPVGRITLTYSGTYSTAANAPTVAL